MQDTAWDSYYRNLVAENGDQLSGAPRRKRGAQPGNQNARKRGLVNKPLTPQQRTSLIALQRAGVLSSGLSHLRVRIAALMLDPRAAPEFLVHAGRLIARLVRAETMPRRARPRQD